MRRTWPSARKNTASSLRRPGRAVPVSRARMRKTLQRRGDGVPGDDGFGKALLGHQVRQGPARGIGFVLLAQQYFQRGDKRFAETRGQFVALARRHLADRIQARAAQPRDVLRTVGCPSAATGRGQGFRHLPGGSIAGRASAPAPARRGMCRQSGLDCETLGFDLQPSYVSASPPRRRTDGQRR